MPLYRPGLRLMILLLMTPLFFTACAGQPPAIERPELRELALEDLNKQLDGENPILALETTDRLFRKNIIDAREQSGYLDRIRSMIDSLYASALAEKSWDEALKYLRAARLSETELSAEPASESELIVREIRRLLEEDNRVPAYTLAYTALTEERLSFKDIEFLTLDAEEAGYDGYVDLLQEDGETGDSTLRQDLPGIVDSTVTIWVNRGIRVERGMGFPDRVIGSGFFIDYRGYILTNYHVIESEVDPEYEGYSRLFIRQGGSSSVKIPARVVGWDPLLDMALLKTEIQPEYVFTPGKAKLRLGDPIYAIGSPGGLEKTITSGIVSAEDRRLLQIGDAMQIDVPINAGNSGGPLLDENGKLVGVVFAGIEIFEGINFAVPVYWLQRILPQLYRQGEVSHAWIGAAMHEGSDGLTSIYAVPDSPAERSGIREGDRLLAINGHEVRGLREVHAMLASVPPGFLVRTLWATEKGAEETVFMQLQQRPRSPILTAYEKDAEKDLILPLFGMKVEETGGTLWEKGFIITKVYQGSVADETGLSVNDPFYWRGFKIDSEQKIALLQMIIKKRKAGFLESSIQLGAYIDVDYFI
jgi:serine protease Do